ncbi:MAG: Gfo/Idh/MocA family oxidoreductase, partial [Kiritimatiellae bacterium]|nr:Gfo/Idh/MocA family oxidoreductase [Kiritimatiellia bacterium]
MKKSERKKIRFGIIGLGLMGREFGSAVARWCHLTDMKVEPEIVAVCDSVPELVPWFRDNFSTITQVTADYKEMLANKDVDAVYCAVPHHLHEQFYCDIIRAGKHLFGEKPFGIDKKANDAIMACIEKNPDVFVRCSSQSPFFPAMQRLAQMIEDNSFGQIIECNSYFLHSSDLNPDKTINWKRLIEINGEYGCMGDLGMHACHMPFRAGWYPRSVRAVLSNIMKERPDKDGKKVPCETWDNATLLCDAEDPVSGESFPLTIKTQRIAPGETNTWYFEVKGTRGCGRWTSRNPRRLEVLEYTGGEQAWRQIDMGWEVAFSGITGGIFEFGFTDLIQQMWAAFLYELTEGKPKGRFASCVTPDEVAYSHRLF